MTDRPTSAAGTRACRVPALAGCAVPGERSGRGERSGPRERSGRAGRPRRTQRGAVTAEAAMVIPVLVLTVVGLAWLLTVAVAQVRVTDAAREVARLVARDETTSTALARGREVAPPGAEFDVSVGERDVVVDVRLDLDGPGAVLHLMPAISVDARAVATREAS